MAGNRKSKGKGRKTNKGRSPLPKAQCLTLEEDEETRCTTPPTHGNPPERCEVHYRQYCKMTQRYKDASKIVDEILGRSIIPSEADIIGYTDYHSVVDKARWMRRYVEAIRAEKVGREIHHQRFFLKSDDGHKIRLKLLAKKMIEAVNTLNAIQQRALDIYISENPGYEWIKEVQASPMGTDSATDQNISPLTEANPFVDYGSQRTCPPQSKPSTVENHEDDLIDIKIRAEKSQLLYAFEPFLDPESTLRLIEVELQQPDDIRLASIIHNTLAQYARRILFYDPVLFLKALNKVSFKDLILDDDFSIDDVKRFVEVWEKRLEIGLLWWKDSVLEALEMSSSVGKNAANVGDPRDRFPMVGGWIFIRRHRPTMTNEHWWHLIKTLDPPADIENRFMRICNNFDDLHSFLSFGALGMMPPPTFCTRSDREGQNSQASRNHLSLCGVVVADMVSVRLGGIFPSKIPATTRGCITWAELEPRAYMFGAIRLQPDLFTNAFLDELRARPDLFYVVLRSETDPGHKVETFGGPPNDILSQHRSRTFEAPFARFDARPRGQGEWTVHRSAVDVLYGTDSILGYLTALTRPRSSGWFFHFKTFPVKYFVILDATPGRHIHHLARQVAWAALRAHKLAEGEYDVKKYHVASDALFQKHASERLAWMPESYGEWHVTKMAE